MQSINYLLDKVINEPNKYEMYYKGALLKDIQGYEPQIKITTKTKIIADTIKMFSIELKD